MSPGKLLTILTCLLAGAAGVALPLLDHYQILNVQGLRPIMLAALAAGVGLIAALGFWVTVGFTLDREIRRITDHLLHLREAESSPGHVPPGFWLRGMTRALNRTLEIMRERVDTLAGQRRELEIQSRVAEAERQHAEAILQSINDAVLVTDGFNEIALANPAAGAALGFDHTDARHQPIDQVVPDRGLVKLIKDTRESANVANRRKVEHRMGHNGGTQYYDVSLNCISDRQHDVAGVVTILHNITREREISEMKSEFVSSVSHELRTPLSSIKAYVEMLVDGEADDEDTRTEFYNIIQSESNRLSRMIDNILNISRIESGVVKIHREQVSLPRVIREAVDVMLPQARAKQIELTAEESPLYYQVHADKDMIYQALLNLIGNAIKYTPEGGRVGVNTVVDDHGQTVTIHVTDSGVGIPADALPQLFDKFYRVKGHKNMAKGTGLGLNLVRHIVETVHGGRVSVTSTEGAGSTFSMALPITTGPN